MGKFNNSRPPLEASLTILKQLLRQDVLQQSPAQAADLYRAAIHLLGALKEDQALLYRIELEHKNNGDNEPATCPSFESIPAISAVVNDADLFRSLVRCLQTATAAGDTTTIIGESNAAMATVLGRKRSISMTGEPSLATTGTGGKAAKLSQYHLSPAPQSRNKAVVGSHHRLLHAGNNSKPSLDVRVFAATCLYIGFQLLDHWPVPLVRAYAEDCFGPRLWVDLPQCVAFVENLALVHHDATGGNGDSNSKELAHDALLVYEAYEKLDSEAAELVDNGSSGLLEVSSLAADELTSDMMGVRWHHSSLSSGSFESAGSGNGSHRDNQQWLNVGVTVSDSASQKNTVVGIGPFLRKDDKNNVALTRSEEQSSKAGSDDNGDSHTVTLPSEAIYPLSQRRVNLPRVRQRFYGKNLEAAHAVIVSTLTDRVDVKSKQNSNLLQCLPSFTSIPGVRCQIAANLEKWLQSPALAGLARTLFTSTVGNMKNTDPPLDADLKAIDSILSMRLKANQLNTHIGNVTAIARRIPVASVASHLYLQLLRNFLVETDGAITSSADSLKMICAIHHEIPSQISYDSIAVGLLTVLAQPTSSYNCASATDGSITDATPAILRSDRARLVKKLRSIIRALSSELGSAFDGTVLIGALRSCNVSTAAWSACDEEDRARLMFQCVTVSVSPFLESFEKSTLSDEEIVSLRQSLSLMRKIILEWCCTEYVLHFSPDQKGNCIENVREKLSVSGEPMYNSVLSPSSGQRKMPSWLAFMRCLLLLEEPESDLTKRFICPDDSFTDADGSVWEQELRRLRVCCCFGRDLSDELLWIVLRSASLKQTIDPDVSIQILENLFEGCNQKSTGSISVSNASLVWEMYNLILLPPPAPLFQVIANNSDVRGMSQEMPRLAHPGLWWRVTMLALVMCAHSATKLGSVIWDEHPTLRALITMVTASRFRFPTIDCDENARAEMKRLEQVARDSETNAAEILFLPPKLAAKSKESKGLRVSRRLLKQQQEKEAAQELEERARRKNLLRAAQTTIMLWDPDGPARKPPRKAVDLLFSVDELFDLSHNFKKSTDPDFLLKTIGKTTRGAIERAYEWLIPIISTLPDTISRLPSSASCFLLLRAYGTEGDERKQLKELASPLLEHVKNSLNGKYGKIDAVKAFDLLMTDVASSKPDRRRCARRVLQDVLAKSKTTDQIPQQWMLNVLELEWAQALVGDAVGHLSTAASYEQGGVLRSIVIALEKYIAFAQQSGIFVERSFCDLLVRLISNRPSAFAAAMEANYDLRSLAVRVLFSSFVERAGPSACTYDSMPSVAIKLFEAEQRQSGTVHFPLALLQSICVVISIWKGSDSEDDKDVSEAVDTFVHGLLRPHDDHHNDVDCGLASAKTEAGGAVAVESWIMLAKSRSDTLAKRAALSAPSGFLPRLLFCSSLPRAPFVAMLDRLGRLGDAAGDKDELYGNLMCLSGLSEWDIGRIGLRRDSARKLLGRLSAYLRIHGVCLGSEGKALSTTFLSWLTEECLSTITRSAKTKNHKNAKTAVTGSFLLNVTSASVLLSTLEKDIPFVMGQAECDLADADLDEFQHSEKLPISIVADYDGHDLNTVRSGINSCLKSGQFIVLNELLELLLAKAECNCPDAESNGNAELVDVSVELLEYVYALQQPTRRAAETILTWIPRLSSASGSPALWKLVLGRAREPTCVAMSARLLTRCMQSWSTLHINQCIDWIIGIDHSASNFDYEGIALFLAECSGQPSSQIELFADLHWSNSVWANSKEFVSKGALIAFRSLNAIPIQVAKRRYSVPPGFILIFLLSRCGKKHLRSICDMILEELSETNAERPEKQVFKVLLLRLYLNFPQWMDLGTSESRNALMLASESFSGCWTNWPSSFDNRIDDLLQFVCNGEMKSVKQLVELSRKQPLLIIRKLPIISAILGDDARAHSLINRKGLIVAENLSGKRDVKFHGKMSKINILHWGYSYTEPTWVSFLDILSSMSPEVLFTCGVQAGLLELLTVYVQLVSVQLELLSADKIMRLKAKLMGAFTAFKRINAGSWTEWLVSDIGDSPMRHLLMKCAFISRQEALDCMKK